MNNIFLAFPYGKRKAFTISYDDGVEQDIKLIKLMEKYNIKGTFNLNAGGYAKEGTIWTKNDIHKRMSKSQCTDVYSNPLVEVAGHSYTHPRLETLPFTTVVQELLYDRAELEQQFGKVIKGMAYPYGSFNSSVKEALEAIGFVYARTTVSHNTFNLPDNFLEWGATCHHCNEKLFPLTDEFINANPTESPMLFYVWGHSYEFDADDNWNVIEDLFKNISNKQDVWYCTNMDIYKCHAAYKQLVWSVNSKKVYNPSSKSVWFYANEKLFEVKSGETISVK